MRVRWTTVCEKCKVVMARGDIAVRVYGRLWHPHCAAEYATERKEKVHAGHAH